jgi:hypothetical protein
MRSSKACVRYVGKVKPVTIGSSLIAFTANSGGGLVSVGDGVSAVVGVGAIVSIGGEINVSGDRVLVD